MPHLTLQISPLGPIVDLLVGVSAPRAKALRAAGQNVPATVPLRGLIDTGASGTCVDADVLKLLSLVPTGSVPIHTPSSGGTPHVCNQFDVHLTILHPNLNLHLQALPVIESALAAQGIQALIGRDTLANCLFVYDGQAGHFSLAF